MQKQILGYLENILFPYLCDYRKNLNKQSALLASIENWRKVFGNKGFGGVVFMKSINTIQRL